MTLDKHIKEAIFENGPMNIAEYMVLALTQPEYGYYMRKDPFGVQGDFTTAPEISQIFGELIGAWLVTQWVMMGKPADCALAEIGPGRGTLMADILRATSKVKGFHDAISVHLMELSPTLRQKQWTTLAGKHPNITWHMGFAEIPAKPLLLVCNEFFDALPIRQYLHEADGWKERKISLDKKGNLEFVFEATEPPEALETEPVSEELYEYCEAARAMSFVIANRISMYGGSALIIDYGYDHGNGDTLQAVRNHRHHEVLEEPGTADLTAHVDFGVITHVAAIGGCTVYGPVGQGFFLNRLGALERTAVLCEKATEKQKEALTSGIMRLTNADQMGTLFKALCIVNPAMPKPEGF